MSSPIVSFDGIGYEIMLFRPDATGTMKEEKHTFGEHSLSVCRAHKEDFQGRTLSPQIKGPPAADGFFYYLYAQPEDVGRPVFTWLQNKEEADALGKAIEDAEQLHWHETDDYYREDYKCTFCGAMASECGEDHGDEMRDIQREALRGGRY
jgi:hypothetical protein